MLSRARLSLSIFTIWILFAFEIFAQDAAPDVSFESLNKAFGINLFKDDLLWDDPADEAATRLDWPKESKTDFVSSYRLYPKADAKAFGTRPFSMALYGEGGTTSQISIIFTNKGDYLTETLGAQRGKDPKSDEKAKRSALREFQPTLKKEEEGLDALLTAALGMPPHRETFGTGDTKELVERWDWKGNAFLLSAPRDEYVGLRILSSASADADGRGDRIPASELRTQLKQRVLKRPNGDVIITQIPMVDQGPKGFCVPATWERYLRYLGISADMYTLAMAGDTGIDGGTNTAVMAANVNNLVVRNGRKVENVRGALDIKTVSKEIDEGMPIMWSCLVYDKLEKKMYQRMKPRAEATDMEAWSKSLDADRKDLSAYRERGLDNGHMRMIIGYNPITNEIAVSDSWGSFAQERWLTVEEAETISQRSLTVIKW